MTDIIVNKEPHNLLTLSSKVKNLSDKALKMLEDGLESEDEKIRLECAKTLLKLDVDISKIINQDSMDRLLLQLKQQPVNNNPVNNTPLVDFSNIQEV